MTSILIVDDDKTITEGLKKMIGTSISGVEIETCYNGLEAWNILQQKAFSIVITDMEMPKMKGLELIEKIDLKIPVLVISGYDDFELVRTSMKKGAYDYLLKPVKQEELISSLRILLNEIPEKNASLVKKPEQLEFSQVLQGHITEGLPNKTIPILFKPLHTSDLEKLQRVIVHIFTARMACTSEIYAECICVLAFENEAETLETIISGILSQESSGIRFSYRIGNQTPCNELEEKLKMLLQEITFSYYDITPPRMQKIKASTLIAGANTAAHQHSIQLLFYYLDSLLYVLIEQQASQDFILRTLTSWFYSLMGEIKDFIRIVSKYKLTEYDFIESIKDASTISALQKTIHTILPVYFTELEKTKVRKEYRIDMITKYIGENIEADLSLNTVAKILEMHPSYFSTFFKHNMGITYREYVRSERLNKAKDLIQQTNHKLYEIAAMVGYEDPAHFSRAYKHFFGISPATNNKQRSN